ncbi:MAG TPA: HAD family hydrolase [Baekduia sp.]|uniref:D-glycero-alpha-D-manno-heptose-1,7-bisphosphate 7-phosphatase n=1 Tax=Baekduia sp. TaxID=2600305 RepID=UPI002C53B92C|nr:HAD family hydrolase [Baekduia sp.]HMJ36396.1 HAD family hydrolase [Baekduia sp.]
MSARSPVAVFLDRDGVLNEPVLDPADGRPESPLRADDVVLADGAAGACRLLADAGFLLVVASNQPAAAKGKAGLDDLWAVHERVADLLDAQGVVIDDWRYCFHHPEAVVAELRGPCDCRKPAPGMLLDAAKAHGIDLPASWMVGDSDGDVLAGQRAGCRTMLIAHPGSAHRRTGAVRPAALSPNVFAAARMIGA